jgi:ABC-type glycerol-3-phosphate transport system substrate-binding protein
MKSNQTVKKQQKSENIKGIVTITVTVVVILLAILLCVLGGRTNDSMSAMSGETVGEISYEESYRAYLEENGYSGTLASAEVSVDLGKFTVSGDLEAEMGEEGVLTEGDGSITWSFAVSEAGFYNLKLGYLALPGTTSDVQREILIDGEVPYRDCSSLVILRWWSDDPITMKGQNEIRPNSYEVYEENEWFLEDSDRRNGEPMMFYLSKGKHTVTFRTIKEPLEYTSLTFVAKESLSSYNDVIGSLKATYPVYSGDTVVLQAERTGDGTEAIKKSATSISVQKNHMDSLVVPYHAYYNRYNTIGADSWVNPGDTVSWTVTAPETGLYEISFKGRQSTNRGVTSYRRLYVNGVVPYEEANAIGFEYSSDMIHYTVSDADGNAMLFYLQQGENEITLETVMGPFGSIVTSVEESLKVLNSAYLDVIQLTGQSPYRYIDYQIKTKVPTFGTSMATEQARLEGVVDQIVAITGEKGENTALLQKMAIEAAGLAEDPEKVIEELPQLKNNISAVGTWIVQVTSMPLELDSIELSSPDQALPDVQDGFAEGLCNGVKRFFASFFIDTNAVGESEGGGEDPLVVWVASYGKEQAQIIQNLVDNSFSAKTDIPVRIQLIPADVVLRAALAGNGPDVVVGLSQSTTQDFAMRNATVNLKEMPGYEETVTVFPESSLMTSTFGDGVYGLPETANFLMMFYREDILGELGIEPPTTWTEFIEMLPILQQNNYSAYVPNAYLNDGSGNLNFYLAMVLQNDGVIYSGEGTDFGITSGLSTNEATEAFKDYTDLYTNYGLNVQVDFSNRFRTGEVPIGITNYTTFCQLEIFAPEIRGQWNFTQIPGTEKEDGTIDNIILVDTANTVIMKQTDQLASAWTFLKWWMQTDTQLDYCQTVESVMGTAARVPSANLEVIEQLPWSNAELRALKAQLESSTGLSAVPGYYMTNRMISYAFSEVISKNSNPRESLYLNVESINKELTRKRQELGLSTAEK